MKRLLLVTVLALAACRVAPSTEQETKIPGLAALTRTAAGTALKRLDSGRFHAVRTDAQATVTVGARYAEGFTVAAPGKPEASLTLAPRHADGILEARPDGVIRYGLASAGAEALIATAADQAEEIVLIAEATGPKELTYQVSHGAMIRTTRMNGGALEAVDANGMVLLRSPRPTVLDAAGRSVTGTYSLQGDLLTVRWPTEGLTYPIAVDPGVTSSTGPVLAIVTGATSSNTHDFGNLPKNTAGSSVSISSPTTFTVMSAGSSAVTVNSINNSNGTNFPTSNITVNGATATLPQILQPGSTLSFDVKFTAPSSASSGQQLSGTISFSLASGTASSLQLTGTPVSATTQGAFPGTMAFDQTYVGTSRVIYVDIYPNSFTASNTFTCQSAPAITGTNASQFSVDTSCTGGTSFSNYIVRIPVTYSPFSSGSATATLTIVGKLPADGSYTTYTVNLTGTGLLNSITVPGALNFTNVRKGTTSTTSFFISNSGNGYDTGSFSITGTYAADFAFSPGTSRAVVPPNVGGTDGTWTWNLNFTPTTTAIETATLTYTSSTGAVKTISLQGTGTFPAIAQPLSSDAGSVRRGTTANMPAVSFQNTGTDTLTLSSLTMVQGYGTPADFQISGGPIVVAAGATVTVTPKFTPSTTGLEFAQAQYNAGDFGTVTVLLSGKGVFPQAVVSPSPLDFGSSRVSVPVQRTLTIQNTGTGQLDLSGFTLTPTTTHFVNTTVFPVSIAAGGQAAFDFTFTPAAAGAETTTATFAGGDYGNITATLTGTGTVPVAAVSPASLDFGTLRQNSSVQKAVTVSNTGAASLTISGYTVTGTDAADYTVSPATGSVIVSPGNSTTYIVTFKPAKSVLETATLTFNTDGGTKTVALTGSGKAPFASYSADSLAFGNVRKGSASTSQTLTVSNAGNDTLTISSVFLSGTNAGDFLVTPTSTPITVNASANTAFGVTFKPTVTGAETAKLSIVTDSGQKDITLTGTGIFASLSLSPGTIDFGTQAVSSTSSAINVTLTNSGTDVATITSRIVGGTHAGDFIITSAPSTIAANGSGTISVKFSPSGTGAESAPITINTDAGNLTFYATGTGIAPQVAVSTTAIAFPNQIVNTRSVSQSVSITNSGTSSLTVSTPVLSGPNSADFALMSPPSTPLTLAPGASTSFAVAFTPTTSASESGTLTLFFGNNISPIGVSLTGSGIATYATVYPTLIPFGTVPVGTTSSAQGFQLANSGTDPLKVSGFTITGPDAAAFSVTPSSNTTVTIPAGQGALWQVTFSPTVVGPAGAVLTFNTDHGSFNTSFSGTGAFPTTVVNATLLDFGSSLKGVTTAPQSFTVTNAGTAPLTLSGWTFVGADAADFRSPATNTTITVEAGATSAPIEVRMTPSHTGTEMAVLQFTSENGAQSVDLVGVGVFPTVVASETALSFGLVELGAITPAQSVVLVNTGTSSSLVTLTLTGPQATSFSVISGASSLTLAPGQTASWDVVFGPSDAGDASATMNFATDSGTLTVALSGTGGDSVPIPAIDPETINFPTLRLGTSEPDQTVTITNNGNANLEVTGYTLTDATPADFQVSPTSAATTIAPGASVTWTVRYAPTAAHGSTAKLTFQTNAGPLWTWLYGNAQFPATTLSTTQLAFGNVRKGTTSSGQSFTVSNPGTTTLNVTSISLTGADAADFALTAPSTPFTVQANGTSPSITLTFTPSRTGYESASVTVVTDNGTQTVTLGGTGIFPSVAVSVSSLSFGTLRRFSTSPTRTFTVTNTGTDTLNVTGFTITGAGANDFLVLPVSAPMTIAPGVSANWGVTFMPTQVGGETAVLTFTDELGSHTILLSGTGVAPNGNVSPLSLSFSSQAKGTLSDPQTVTLNSTGTDALTVVGYAITGANAADFFVSPGSQGSSVAVGNSTGWRVTFRPSSGGVETATLTITTELGDTAVALTGVGINAPLTVSPTAADLGHARVRTVSSPTTFTVTNVASQPFAVQSFTFTGTNAAEFTVAESPQLPKTLAPGLSFTFSVTFTPQFAGQRSASVVIGTGDVGTTLQVPLTGTGIASTLSLDPVSYDYGPIVVNVHQPHTMKITNTGTDVMAVQSITLGTGSSAFVLADLPPLPTNLAPGLTATFTVIYTPPSISSSSSVVTVTTDSPLGASGTISLTGNGIAPTITTSSTSLSFGSVRVGSTGGVRVFTITNTGTLNARVEAIVLQGAAQSDFQVVSQPETPFTLAAGSGSATIAFGFKPTVHGVRAANAILTTNATSSAIMVSLNGVGIEPAINASPTSLDFHVVALGSPATVQTVSLTNDGDTALHLAAPYIDGSGADAFSVQVPAEAVEIESGASVTLPVSFFPKAGGTLAATLHLKSADTDALAADIALIGVAVAPALTVPDAVDFGLVSVGEKSASKTLTLTNSSSADLIITDLRSDTPEFVLTTDQLPITLHGQSSISPSVVFSPIGDGDRVGHVQIYVEGQGTAVATVALNGQGQLLNKTVKPGNCASVDPSQGALLLSAIAMLAAARRRRRPAQG